MLERFEHKKIGIWGFGATGQSILKFLSPYAKQFYVLESKPLNPEQIQLLKTYNAYIVNNDLLSQFLEACDVVIPSPGVNITPYLEQYPNLFVSELDIFGTLIKKPVIAITGSLGKTTTVSLLEQILNLLGKRIQAIGNIGKPMLSALRNQNDVDYFILEISSFQLEHTRSFAPDIATIINITENHLDRHKTMHAYLQAKGRLLSHQREEQIAILPMAYMDSFWPFVHHQKVIWVANSAHTDIIKALSDVACAENLTLILAIIEHLGFEPESLLSFASKLHRPAHRMEYVRTHNGLTFYNDSKSTVIEATLQALTQLHDKTTILLLGGLSKGVYRQPLIQQLPHSIKHVICFGSEAEQLNTWCQENVIPSSAHATLEDACNKALSLATSGDIILLSPAGSSYDLFNNFEERGNRFKEIVNAL